MPETNSKHNFGKLGALPWIIAAISLTFAISDRLNAPGKDIASLSERLARIEEKVGGVQKTVDEMKLDLKRHTESGR